MSFLSSLSSAVRSVAQTASSVVAQVQQQAARPQQQAPSLGHSTRSQFVPSATASGPAAPTQKVDINSPAGKKALIEGSSQVNPVSNANGNSDVVCSGAAVANALVLTAKTPEAAKQNAAALRQTANSLGIPPRKEEEAALKALESGKMSPTDLAHLQQLSYRVVKYADPMLNTPLAAPGEMAFATTMLRANGAFAQEPNVTFHAAQSPGLGGANHWTTTVGNQHADSMTGPSGGAGLSTGTPAHVMMDSQNAGWRGEVNVNNGTPPQVTMAIPGPRAGTATWVEVNDPAQFKMESFTDLQKAADLARRIQGGQVIRLGHTVVD